MMKIVINPARSDWGQLLQRPAFDQTVLFDTVKGILQDVKTNGDEAIRNYSLQFDKIKVDQLELTNEEIDQANSHVSPDLQKAIQMAAANITRFHEQQIQAATPIETMPGVTCWRRSVAIDKVGLYIPGGTAPLFSTVLMLGIPAKLAGCREIVLASPPNPSNGRTGIHPAILVAARLAGITRIFKIGGAQAIAAMAYGTTTVPSVYKIFGPGNQYVNCAKQLVQMEGVAIDMPAGPSEVCILADESCNPAFVAADLLSQAEHGTDSQVLLICTNQNIIGQVLAEIDSQLPALPRKQMIEQSLRNSHAIVLPELNVALSMVNEYAPEHLIIACGYPEGIAENVVNAGSVFIGNYSPESAGDYAVALTMYCRRMVLPGVIAALAWTAL